MPITFTPKTWADYQEGPYLEASELNRLESALDALVNGTSRAVRLDGDTMTGGLTLSAGNLNLATGDIQIGGTRVVGARKAGWSVATGTATRTTFDTATVTLPQLAERVKAIVDDLHATAGHGMFGS